MKIVLIVDMFEEVVMNMMIFLDFERIVFFCTSEDAPCEGECDSPVGVLTKTCSNEPYLPVKYCNSSDMQSKPCNEGACCGVEEIK